MEQTVHFLDPVRKVFMKWD